jgi:hypothetical protein
MRKWKNKTINLIIKFAYTMLYVKDMVKAKILKAQPVRRADGLQIYEQSGQNPIFPVPTSP